METAVDIITGTAKLKRYQPMTYSLACMRNVELARRVRAALADLDVDVDVQAEGGKLRVRTRDSGRGTAKRVEEIRQRASAHDGVEHVEVIGPAYAKYVFGPEDTDQLIKGSAGEWCRVAVRRRSADETSLKAQGAMAEMALKVVRAYL